MEHFCPFNPLLPPPPLPLTAQKIKISKKRKQYLEISSFNTSVPKIMIIWFTVPEIWWVTDVIVIFHCAIFCSFTPPPPNSPKNENFKTMKKMPGDIIILQKFTKNHYHMLHSSWDMTHDTHILPLNSKKKKKRKKKNRKNEKNSWTYHHFKIMIK